MFKSILSSVAICALLISCSNHSSNSQQNNILGKWNAYSYYSYQYNQQGGYASYVTTNVTNDNTTLTFFSNGTFNMYTHQYNYQGSYIAPVGMVDTGTYILPNAATVILSSIWGTYTTGNPQYNATYTDSITSLNAHNLVLNQLSGGDFYQGVVTFTR